MAAETRKRRLFVGPILAIVLAGSAAATELPVNNTAPALRLANDRGVAETMRKINITVQVKLRDQDVFDRILDELYDPASPMFHKWLSDADLKRFRPPDTEIAMVRSELQSHGLTILSIDRNGFSIRARGALGDVAKAFNTEIHEFERNGQMFRANVRDARLSGAAGSYVTAIAGIESHVARPMLARAINLKTNLPNASVPVEKAQADGGLSSLVTDQILGVAQLFTYKASGDALPTATYHGLVYDAAGEGACAKEASCKSPDYTPSQLQSIYGLTAAYKRGLDGKGQTIVLLEGYGYPTIKADANAFFGMTGLPKLTSANFDIVYPEGKPTDPDISVATEWNIEIALDVQWAHAMAPGAKIIVIATNGQDSEDFQESMRYIIDHKLGNSVSDSWGVDTDLFAGPDEQKSYENLFKVAAMKGISFQFSTGDSGDNGLGTPVGAPGVPASSPHATATGGTAILNRIGTTGFDSVGWGDSWVTLAAHGPSDPPKLYGLVAGGGGGSSVYWPKPSWQNALPGKHRQTPDVSALADPYTGVPIIITDPATKKQMVEPGWGGTSLSSPIFTAIWAIANQKAGHALGAAGPTIAALKSGLTDVLPLSSKDDVTGSVTDKKGKASYSSAALFNGLVPKEQSFVSGIYNEDAHDAYAFGFALDSSFTVTKGWDNATGYGTPNGLAFINAAAALGNK